jgi:hypothetical protein
MPEVPGFVLKLDSPLAVLARGERWRTSWRAPRLAVCLLAKSPATILYIGCFVFFPPGFRGLQHRTSHTVHRGHSADVPVFLAMLSAATGVALPDGVVATGHMALQRTSSMFRRL